MVVPVSAGPQEIWVKLPDRAQRKVKHAVMAAVIAATTVLIRDMLKPPHALHDRPHHPPDHPRPERSAGHVRHQRGHGLSAGAAEAEPDSTSGDTSPSRVATRYC